MWFISRTSPLSPPIWLFISSQWGFLSPFHLFTYSALTFQERKTIKCFFFLPLAPSQKENHVPKDCGPSTYIWRREEMGGIHVFRDNQKRDCHVSSTNCVYWCRAFTETGIFSSFQGHDDDSLWLVSYYKALGSAEQGEAYKINNWAISNGVWLKSWSKVDNCLSYRLPCLWLQSFGSRVIWKRLYWSNNPL